MTERTNPNRVAPPVVTIDGPAGAGKSTTARRLARQLGYGYVNSGSIYRALAWRVATGMSVEEALVGSHIQFRGEPEHQRVVVNGADVTEALTQAEVGSLASTLSQRSEVRAHADALQRELAARGPVVVEGRDAGTTVFPDADCKFYLDASLDARARRRLAERVGRGEAAELDSIRGALAARDLADRTRTFAPLSRAPDATYVDSSDMTVDEVVDVMLKKVECACSTQS